MKGITIRQQERQSGGLTEQSAGAEVANATFDVPDRRAAGVPGDTEIDIVCCLHLW